jgi:hypothetical protein
MWNDIEGETDTIISLPGRDVNFVRDVFMCATKYFHVLESVKRNIQHGSMTWAMVDAYHAALLGTRLFGAIYGILSYTIRGRTVLIDYRPNLGSPDDVKAFRREAKGVDDPVRLLRPQPKHLEQADAWALVTRLCSISRPQAEDVDTLRLIKELSQEKISAFRNLVLYDSVAWEWLDDFGTPPASLEIRQDRLADINSNQTLTLQILSQMFGYMRDRLAVISSKVGYELRRISPLAIVAASPTGLLG